MSQLCIEELHVKYGSTTALDSVSLEVQSGEMVSVLGPSGCGKSSLLRAVAGFIPPAGGRIVLGGKDITNTPPYNRNIGVVFQNYALFPHLTVAKNVAYGLRMRGVPKGERHERVQKELDRVSLGPYANRRPGELSGGQQQRAAVARALVIRPELVLFDEPLSNLDAALRESLRVQLTELQRDLEFTAIFVTHDHREAMSVSDRMVILESGNIRVEGRGRELYKSPQFTSIANLLGSANLLEGQSETNDPDHIDWSGVRLPVRQSEKISMGPVTVMVRPEAIRYVGRPQGREKIVESADSVEFAVGVRSVLYQGDRVRVVLETDSGGVLTMNADAGTGAHAWQPDERILVQINVNDVAVVE